MYDWLSSISPTSAIEVLTPLAILGVFGLLLAGAIPIWAAAVAVGPLFLLTFVHLSQVPDDAGFDFRPRTASAALGFAGWSIAGALGFYLLYRWMAISWPLPLQIPAFIFFGVATFVLSVTLTLPRSRASVVRFWGVWGSLGPATQLALTVIWLTSFFAAATFVMERHNVVELVQRNSGSLSVEEIATFYAWHFLEAVPVLKIPETLRWAPPLMYTDSQTGVLVLTYKIAVILPVIATFFVFWKERTAPEQDS